VTVEVKQVEREVGQPIRLATIERVLEVADVRHATVVFGCSLLELITSQFFQITP
jgi:hypothetical protein